MKSSFPCTFSLSALILLSLSACGGAIEPLPIPENPDAAAQTPDASSLMPEASSPMPEASSPDAPCPNLVPGWAQYGCDWVDTCTKKCLAPVDAGPSCSCTGADDGGGIEGYVCGGVLQTDAVSCAVCGKRCDGGV